MHSQNSNTELTRRERFNSALENHRRVGSRLSSSDDNSALPPIARSSRNADAVVETAAAYSDGKDGPPLYHQPGLQQDSADDENVMKYNVMKNNKNHNSATTTTTANSGSIAARYSELLKVLPNIDSNNNNNNNNQQQQGIHSYDRSMNRVLPPMLNTRGDGSAATT
eukprot:Lankesteria_metandrocarpae@DN8912_c0_g1_i1.p1